MSLPRRAFRRGLCSVAAIACVLASASSAATAGGLFLPYRGVHASARGGAWIAGARGAAALGINPAGLVLAQDIELLVDASYVQRSATFTRIDGDLQELEPVSNQASGMPIPTLAAVFPLGQRVVLGAGMYAPYTGMASYPEDGPQRYALIDMNGTLASVLDLSVAVRVSERVRIGAGVQNMPMRIGARMAMSACPTALLCGPEDPLFDVIGQVEQTSLVNLAANLGIQADLGPLRIGVAAQLPFHVTGQGRLSARMGQNAILAGTEVATGAAKVSMTIPASVRAGVEVDLGSRARVELAASREMWSQSSAIGVELQELTLIGGIAGIADTLGMDRMDMMLGFRDTTALMAGVELEPLADEPLTLLGGYTYESAAAPDEYASVTAADGDRHMLSAGLGYEHGRYSFHGVVGMARVGERHVSPDEGKLAQNNLTAELLGSSPVYVNWGEYRSSWLIAGLGMNIRY